EGFLGSGELPPRSPNEAQLAAQPPSKRNALPPALGRAAPAGGGSQWRGAAPERLDATRRVAALPRLDPGRAQPSTRVGRQPPRTPVDPPELRSQAIGMLEAVADELVRTMPPLEPVGPTLRQRGHAAL